eukprot:TRINITY_DN17229_c0_g1_i1.p1 TRINITY_DN17229_c0_g1~~TRINITY_DN17229_c0_g1_i1.p1  ORF type:complete len:326 (-),score=39.45 TRINITY_DN17229_c0_g1_i1:44-1021(-)
MSSYLDTILENEPRHEAVVSYRGLMKRLKNQCDDMIWLIATLCNCPMANIALVGKDDVVITNSFGCDANDFDLRDVKLKTKEERKKSYYLKSLVAGSFMEGNVSKTNDVNCGNSNIRFYAGFPLRTSKGFLLGTLSVFDTNASRLNKFQIKTISMLTSNLMALLDLHYYKRRLKSLIRMVNHDMRQPLSIIQISSDLLSDSIPPSPTISREFIPSSPSLIPTISSSPSSRKSSLTPGSNDTDVDSNFTLSSNLSFNDSFDNTSSPSILSTSDSIECIRSSCELITTLNSSVTHFVGLSCLRASVAHLLSLKGLFTFISHNPFFKV